MLLYGTWNLPYHIIKLLVFINKYQKVEKIYDLIINDIFDI